MGSPHNWWWCIQVYLHMAHTIQWTETSSISFRAHASHMLASQPTGLEILDRHSAESDEAKSGKTMSSQTDGCLEVLQRWLCTLPAMEALCFRAIVAHHYPGYFFLSNMEDEITSTGYSLRHVHTSMDRIRIWSICISITFYAACLHWIYHHWSCSATQQSSSKT